MSEKILINTGPSRAGWHRLEAYLRCPQLFAWGYGQGGSNREKAKRFPPTAPLVRGSIGHAGLAHCYARLQAVQQRRDPDDFFEPHEAMRLVSQDFGELGEEMLPIAQAAVSAYVERYGHEAWEIVGVETPREIRLAGHLYTARVDLEIRDRAGMVWFVDHKFVSKIENKVRRRYMMSGQGLGLTHIGAQTWGPSFGGVRFNLVGVSPIGFERFSPDVAPWLLERFPETVDAAEKGISAIGDSSIARLSPSEHTCFGPYGECPAIEMCRFGGHL